MAAMSIAGVDDDVRAVGADAAKRPVDDLVARSDAQRDQRAFMQFAESSEEWLPLSGRDVLFRHGFNVGLMQPAAKGQPSLQHVSAAAVPARGAEQLVQAESSRFEVMLLQARPLGIHPPQTRIRRV